MLEIRKAGERGIANLGWLHSRHTFSFGSYRDPQHMGFSELLVINDDRVQPRQGFGTHSHENMEILSYVLEGALAHQDSMGNGSMIAPGDVQLMSAGSGVSHSEFNHSATEPVHFLQIWITPQVKDVAPSYQQKAFTVAEQPGHLRLILSRDGAEDSLRIHQDVRAYAGVFNGEDAATLVLGPARYAYVHVARGSIDVNGQPLEEGDGAQIRGEQCLTLSGGRHAEVLVFNLPPHELPTR